MMIQSDEVIFFRGVGWNHQPVLVISYDHHSYGHLPVITGYKWDYTFYKWGYKYSTDKWPQLHLVEMSPRSEA